MRSLKHIIGLALVALAFSACEDGAATDKAQLDVFDNNGSVYVYQNAGNFEIHWEDMRLRTTDGTPVVTVGDKLSYNVCVGLDDHFGYPVDFKVIKNVAGTSTTVSVSEIIALLGQEVLDRQILFGVFLVDENGRYFFSSKTTVERIDVEAVNNIQTGFKTTNNWFAEGYNVYPVVQSGMAKIGVGQSSEPFDAQFCNIFQNLSQNQKEGASFQLTFDVMWVGPDSKSTKSISIVTGKNADYQGGLHYNYQWNSDNTELLAPDGGIYTREDYQLPNRQFTTVTFGGIIGEAGSKYIGIQINLGETEEVAEFYDEDFVENTFYFKNMRVLIDGVAVSESFMERTKGDFYVGVEPSDGGQVLGAGYYMAGEKVQLTAVPDRNKGFNGWSEGNTDNPLTILVNTNTQVKAFFGDSYGDGRSYKVAASAGNGEGYVDGTGLYGYAEMATLTAVPYSGYVFSSWSDGYTGNPREFYVYDDIELVAYFESKNLLAKGYPGTNEWFVDGQDAIEGYVEDGKLVINVGGEGEVWNDNLEVVFHGLKNQVEGNEFLLEFDIAWEGAGDNTTAGFRICSGVDNYMPQISETDPTFVPLNTSDVWNPEYNTELIFGDDFYSGMGKTFTVGAESQHIQWGGTIGERGEKYIGIEINLAGIEDEEGVHPNGPGTFTISNMRIIINEEQVW